MTPIKNITNTKTSTLLSSKQLEIHSLLEVTQAINNNLSASELFRIYEFILRAQMGVDRLCLYIKNLNTDEWNPAIFHNVNKNAANKLNIEKHLIPIEEIAKTKGIKNSFLKQFHVIIPVYHKNIPLAYSLIGNFSKKLEDFEDALIFIQTITNIIAVAIENKRLFKQQLEREGLRKELELAAQMQSLLMPDKLPKNKYLEMTATYIPHSEVGGDFYDVFQLNEQETAFCIADVSGKGMPAALLMSNFQATLRALIFQGFPIKKLIANLNKQLANITKGEKFITLFLAVYNYSTKKLTYVNAGHNPPYLLMHEHDNKIIIKALDKGATILGMFDKLPFIQSEEIEIKDQAMLLSYTDGLIEAENEQGEYFENNRIIKFMEENVSLDIEKFKAGLLNKLDNFKGKCPYSDDITILVCRIL